MEHTVRAIASGDGPAELQVPAECVDRQEQPGWDSLEAYERAKGDAESRYNLNHRTEGDVGSPSHKPDRDAVAAHNVTQHFGLTVTRSCEWTMTLKD
jgi:hypothetical protein